MLAPRGRKGRRSCLYPDRLERRVVSIPGLRYFYRMNIKQGILTAIDQALRDRNMSDRMASLRATGKPDTIRNIRRGSFPRIETLTLICDSLDIKLTVSAQGPDIPMENTFSVEEQGASGGYQAGSRAVITPFQPGLGPVGRDIKGHFDHKAPIQFDRAWLRQQGLSERYLRVAWMNDNSVAPILTKGDTLLVDCSITQPRPNELMVIKTKEMVSIKRLVRLANVPSKQWLLAKNGRESSMTLLGKDHEIMGCIVWRGGQLS